MNTLSGAAAYYTLVLRTVAPLLLLLITMLIGLRLE